MRVLGDWVDALVKDNRLSEEGYGALAEALKSPDQSLRDRAGDLMVKALASAGPQARAKIVHLLQGYWWPPALGLTDAAFSASLPAAAEATDDEVIQDTMLLWSHLARVNPELMDSLVDTLSHASPGVRRAGSGALSRMGSAAAEHVPELVRLLEDADPKVAESALEALSILGPLNVEPSLTAFRAEVKGQGRRRFLGLTALRGLLEHARIAEMALPQDSEDDERAMIAALEDTDSAVRIQAAAVLGLRPHTHPQVEQALMKTLADPQWDVAAAAAVALLRLRRGEDKALELLGTQLLSPELTLQDSAIYALEPLEVETLSRARPALEQAAANGVGNGKEAAKGLLLRLR